MSKKTRIRGILELLKKNLSANRNMHPWITHTYARKHNHFLNFFLSVILYLQNDLICSCHHYRHVSDLIANSIYC